jgi:aminoglycoside phosphotransferase (APT) family kinase protein
VHGDLHARNVLVQNGRITGVIDWGDLTSGDVATDLASIWMLFADAAARQNVITHYSRSQTMDEATLKRARGWAVLFGVMLLDTGLIDHPQHAAMGASTLQRLTEDAMTPL